MELSSANTARTTRGRLAAGGEWALGPRPVIALIDHSHCRSDSVSKPTIAPHTGPDCRYKHWRTQKPVAYVRPRLLSFAVLWIDLWRLFNLGGCWKNRNSLK